jgi:tetratricopeptide (TPR) repeat protein
MSPSEILAMARAGDMVALTANIPVLTSAVHSMAEHDDANSALEIVGRAWRVWASSGKLEEGSGAAMAALEAPGDQDDVWRARALYGAGVLAFRTGDDDRSMSLNEELLRLARSTGDVRGRCDALTGLARVALRAGDYPRVVELARQARAHARSAGDPSAEAAPLHLEAAGTRLMERYEEARVLYLESLDLNRLLGSEPSVAMEQHNLGWVDIHRGAIEAAEEWFRERDAAAVPDAYGQVWSELNWAAVDAERGNVASACSRLAAGKKHLEELGVALDPDDRFELDWLTKRLAAD